MCPGSDSISLADPRMVDAFVNGDTFLGLESQHSSDQIFARFGDRVPLI